MRIGKHIRNLRKSQGMTQVALATRAGVSQSTVSDVENDVRLADEDLVMRLTTLLGGSVTAMRQSAAVPCHDIMEAWQPRAGMRSSEISFDVRLNQARQTLGARVVDDVVRQFRAREEAEWSVERAAALAVRKWA
jgi:transcriptional regulator with XRE-family HTH domain